FARAPTQQPDSGETAVAGDRAGGGGGAGDEAEMEALRRSLLEALMGNDMESLLSAVGGAVDRLSGFEPGRPVGGTYYLYRTLRRLDIDQLEALVRDALAGREGDLTELERRLVEEELTAKMERLREAVQEEIRR